MLIAPPGEREILTLFEQGESMQTTLARLTKANRRNYAARGLVLLMCVLLSGCGLFSVTREAELYRKKQAEDTAAELRDCMAKPSGGSPHDHRRDGETSPDCYLALVDSSARLLRGTGRAAGGRSLAPSREGGGVAPRTAQELSQLDSAPDVIGEVAWMAMISNMVYHRFVKEEFRGGRPGACVYGLQDYDPLDRLNGAPSTTIGTAHWERWEQLGLGCNATGGLFYETFVYRAAADDSRPGSRGKIVMAIVAFRGTENFKGQFDKDWGANLASTFNELPAQYAEVQRRLPDLVKALQDAAGHTIPIYATGHSLGGGLAQAAAYMRKEITAAYVFNTSPVTGWTTLSAQYRDDPAAPLVMQTQDPQVIRVLQDDEVLGLVRLVTNAANTTVRRYNRSDVYFDFPSTRKVIEVMGLGPGLAFDSELHSITLLACNLAARVEMASGPVAFGFTPAMAARARTDAGRAAPTAGAGGPPSVDLQQGLCQIGSLGASAEEDKRIRVDWLTGGAAACAAGACRP